jgi:membrane-associated phospholipid phosphatase
MNWFPLVATASLAAAVALDRSVVRWAVSRELPPIRFETYALFLVAGYWPLWAIVGVALVLVDAGRPRTIAWTTVARGGGLMASAGLGGLAAEALKLVVRRLRPALDAEYAFRSWSDGPFNSSNLGFPSSHVAVAFGAVCWLSFRYPRATPIWLIIGVGCALTRLVLNRHYLSDVVGGALVGFLAARLVWRWTTR